MKRVAWVLLLLLGLLVVYLLGTGFPRNWF